jgi:hypothetical protein
MEVWKVSPTKYCATVFDPKHIGSAIWTSPSKKSRILCRDAARKWVETKLKKEKNMRIDIEDYGRFKLNLWKDDSKYFVIVTKRNGDEVYRTGDRHYNTSALTEAENWIDAHEKEDQKKHNEALKEYAKTNKVYRGFMIKTICHEESKRFFSEIFRDDLMRLYRTSTYRTALTAYQTATEVIDKNFEEWPKTENPKTQPEIEPPEIRGPAQQAQKIWMETYSRLASRAAESNTSDIMQATTEAIAAANLAAKSFVELFPVVVVLPKKS